MYHIFWQIIPALTYSPEQRGGGTIGYLKRLFYNCIPNSNLKNSETTIWSEPVVLKLEHKPAGHHVKARILGPHYQSSWVMLLLGQAPYFENLWSRP